MSPAPPSHVYYFEVGSGRWTGSFTFRVDSWREVRRAGIGVKNTLLVAAMAVTQKVTGASQLTSVVVPHPDEGEFGVVDNAVALSRLHLKLYDLRERYVLDPDGRTVKVIARERFGPLPGILTRTFEYPAEIGADGLGSVYHMPLLGSPWTATYQVGPDRRSLAGTLRCRWATAHEAASKAASP